MSATGLDVFDTTLQETNAWLNDVMEQWGIPADHRDEALRRRAYHALRSVLVTTRDRLPADLSAAMGAQLPLLVRGVYYEGYDPSRQPEDYRDVDTFVERIGKYAHRVDIDPNDAISAVFAVLNERLTDGMADKVVQSLPEKIRNRWPAHESTG